MSKPRNPHANNSMATARVSDVTKTKLRALAAKSGKTLSEITRKAIMAGLPIVESEIKKHPKQKTGHRVSRHPMTLTHYRVSGNRLIKLYLTPR